jgi:hypothetical protein
MVLRNRSWSINNSKDSLLKEIDNEISKEYQIITKYSSEKFSIVGLIIGFLAAIVALYNNWIFSLPHSDFMLFYTIAACLVLFYWTYAERASNFFKKILKISTVDNINQEKTLLKEVFLHYSVLLKGCN